ncbi:hypothetical protein DPMN_177325 [Dreissena polymorpha]|uniref:Integrin beta subunit tail domain-containing protein n=1 Tax=Dreissena polymorpha TaxID=45954 RepID=A0A9D4EAZ8_DREPO|nr:hypothetical protein DPMN_177325 [Dreissena polymorpha]
MIIRALILQLWIFFLINAISVQAKPAVCDERKCYATTGEVCNGRGVCECGLCACETGYSGPTCDTCVTCTSSCENFKDCVSCKIFGTGKIDGTECSTRCDKIANYLPVDINGFDNVEDGLIKCNYVNNKFCVESFKLDVITGGIRRNVFVRKDMDCSKQPADVTIVLDPPQRSHAQIIRHTKEDTGDPKDHDVEGIIDMFSESENNKVYDDGDISSETEETDENGGIEDDDDYEEDYDDYFEDDDEDDDDDYYENNDGEDSEDSSETNEANEGDVEMGTLKQKDQKEEDVIILNSSIVNGRFDDVHIVKIANVTKNTEDELVETVLLQGVPVESNEASSTGYNTASTLIATFSVIFVIVFVCIGCVYANYWYKNNRRPFKNRLFLNA